MTKSLTDDQPVSVAEAPEHCHDCSRLIRPGQTYLLTMELAALCPDCARTADAIRLAGGLTVEVQEDRLLVRRGSSEVEIFPHEVRHTSALLCADLVEALVEAAARLVERRTQELGGSQRSRERAVAGWRPASSVPPAGRPKDVAISPLIWPILDLPSHRSEGKELHDLPDPTSRAQAHLHQPRERHSSPVDRLP